MAKATIVTNIKFKQVGQSTQFRELLKYLQYRKGSLRREAFLRGEDTRGINDHELSNPAAKWVDRGMGETHQEIAGRAHDLSGHKLLARTWVISPDPELMWHIPEEQRLGTMQRITERVMDEWYENNGWGQPEYSYVIHDKNRASDSAQMLHAHVITPGTIPLDEPGTLTDRRMEHMVKRPHIIDLQRTSASVFQDELERVLGQGRAQTIIRQRDERHLRENRDKALDWHKLGRAHDVLTLLRRAQEDKKRKNRKLSDRERRRRRMEDVRIYARHLTDRRWKQNAKARTERWAARRQASEAVHLVELEQARQDQARYRERMRSRRQRLEPRAEQLASQEQLRQQQLKAYYAQLFAYYDTHGIQRERQVMGPELGIDP